MSEIFRPIPDEKRVNQLDQTPCSRGNAWRHPDLFRHELRQARRAILREKQPYKKYKKQN